MVVLNYDRKAKKLEHTVKLGLVIVSGFNLMKYNQYNFHGRKVLIWETFSQQTKLALPLLRKMYIIISDSEMEKMEYEKWSDLPKETLWLNYRHPDSHSRGQQQDPTDSCTDLSNPISNIPSPLRAYSTQLQVKELYLMQNKKIRT